jgi:tetratricopeptide (TPR) repeat protein
MARWLTELAGERGDLVAEAIAEHHALALESLPALAGGALPDRATLAAAAAAWYERAAEAALRLSAVDAARRLFGRAVELTAEDASLDRARRRLRLGEVLASSAELDVGIGEIEAARAELEALPGATEEYERATYALGRAYMQQIRFPEASAVTAEALARLTDASPPILARLHALHAWSLAANGQPDGVVEEANAALAAAREGDDPERELEVLEHWCAAGDELDLVGEDEWRLLGEKAEALGRWQQVAVAGRVTAMHRSMSDPAGSIADFERALEVATAHGLTEQAGWSEYALAEVRWVLGDVEGAVTGGERALAVAERYAYERLAFRTFVVLLHIAAERGDVAMADRWDRWWSGAGVHFPANTSPYGQVLRGGYLVALSRIRGEPPRGPDASLLDALQPMVNPHYVVAVEAIVQAWLATGRRDLAEAAGARVAEAAQVEFATPLMRASAALIEAWVTGSHEAAARAAEIAAGIPAPSWEARARAAAP